MHVCQSLLGVSNSGILVNNFQPYLKNTAGSFLTRAFSCGFWFQFLLLSAMLFCFLLNFEPLPMVRNFPWVHAEGLLLTTSSDTSLCLGLTQGWFFCTLLALFFRSMTYSSAILSFTLLIQDPPCSQISLQNTSCNSKDTLSAVL